LGLLEGAHVVCGGIGNPETLQIAPTVLDSVTGDSAVMQEEIFGPLLPVLTYHTLDEAIAFIGARPKPLALYLFSTHKATQAQVLDRCSFGGGCINDTVVHLASHAMPFGGVGESGMGGYHGKKSFETFSHYKSIVDKANWIDLPVRYRPYTDEKKKLLRLFLK
jgi:aldehyde dehydrogenase (NAD+)